MYAVTLQALAHEALRRALALARERAVAQSPGGAARLCAVDGTAGNGHDTLFLAQEVGEGGRVWAFDVQQAALTATRARLEAVGLKAGGLAQRVQCVLDGHEHLERHVPPDAVIHGAMFNLGYLPGAPRSDAATVVTSPATTLAALEAVLHKLASGGVLSVHIYTGHAGAEEECAALLPWAASLKHPQWQVLHVSTANKPHRVEHLLLISRT